MRKLQPLNENVLLEIAEDKGEKKTASGLIIPDSAKEKEATAKVVAIGGNVEKPEISVGETVLYKDFSGNKIEFEGKKYLFIAYDDILAKLV